MHSNEMSLSPASLWSENGLSWIIRKLLEFSTISFKEVGRVTNVMIVGILHSPNLHNAQGLRHLGDIAA
jgi:hypothetical protein